MADPVPPIEIPWQLSATTRRLGETNLASPTISLFTYWPTLPEEIAAAYRGERLLYLKFVISVSPLLSGAMVDDEEVAEFLDELLIRPVKRLVFDLKIWRGDESRSDDIKPYFIAAAPLRREMVESGVVGAETFSGESSSVSVGKSFSTFHEDFTTSSTTDTGGWNLGLFAGNSTQSTISGSRDTSRTLDITNREAAEERKDLLSHVTTVNNILTLLSAHHLGSPYLRFSVWPAPLRTLTTDPADPNIWYAELLRKRSSGIEGVQDFYVIAVVPREGEFCVEAKLKQICVAQPPPPAEFEPEPAYRRGENFLEVRRSEYARILAYLNRRYPAGTLVEELDVELHIPDLTRPVVGGWVMPHLARGMDPFDSLRYEFIVLIPKGINTRPVATETIHADYGWSEYKTLDEVWLETQRAEFERRLLQSPLDVGEVISTTLTLTRCWGHSALDPTGTTGIEPGRIEDWRIRTAGTSWSAPGERPSERVAAYRRAVFTWNALEDELTQYVMSSNKKRATPFSPGNPAITRLILESLSGLSSEHRLNRPIEAAEKLFGFRKARIAQLRRKGIVDFRGLARTLLDLPTIERYNEQIEQVRDQLRQLPQKDRPKILPESLPLTLNRQDAVRVYGDLLKGFARHSSVK